jgi:hypothetical protein
VLRTAISRGRFIIKALVYEGHTRDVKGALGRVFTALAWPAVAGPGLPQNVYDERSLH